MRELLASIYFSIRCWFFRLDPKEIHRQNVYDLVALLDTAVVERECEKIARID